jgi:hypothetical protein
VLRGILVSKRDDVRGDGKDYIKRRFMLVLSHQISFGLSNKEE